MLMMGRPDFACIEVRKEPCEIDSRSFSSIISAVIPQSTSRVYVVLTEASKALLFLRPLMMVIVTALAGTPSASDTLSTMACMNDSLSISVVLIPSKTWYGSVSTLYVRYRYVKRDDKSRGEKELMCLITF
jgi:hypothetical protein